MSKDIALTKEDLIKLSEEYGQYGNAVDVVKLANRFGIKVYEYPFGDGVSGAVRKKENGEVSIYISDQDSVARQRFSIAHELAHAVLHKDIVDSHKVIKRSKNDFSCVEIEANKLAEEILMPEKSIIRLRNLNYNVPYISYA